MARKIIKTPARYYVATYGNDGLCVELFTDPLAYGRAVKEAKRRWEVGDWDIDSYTYGDCTISQYAQEEVAA
jgi:hypothetical protein